MEEHYSVKQVAAKLGVSERTVQREIKKGNLLGIAIGNKYSVSREQYDIYTQKHASNIDDKIREFCQDKKSEMMTLLQNLVALPGESGDTSGQEKLACLIKKELDEYGIRNVIYGKDDAITVQGTYGFAKKGLLLDCPLDTTTAGDIACWEYPPYAGVIEGGRMYGRGTADAKAGIVSMIYAIRVLKEYIDEERLRIEFICDGGEQDGHYRGMKLALDRGLHIDAGIIGYAGDANEIAIGARGYHRYSITTKGKAEHTGSRKRQQSNAISFMALVIQALDSIEFPSAPASHDQYFAFGSKLTCAMIQGGQAINIVPDICMLSVDIRTTPDITREYVDVLIRHALDQLQNQHPDADMQISIEYLGGIEGYQIDAHAPIVSALTSSMQKVSHRPLHKAPSIDPEIVVNGPAHIGNLLDMHRIDVIVKGPAGGNVHGYNEYVEIDSVVDTAVVYAIMILSYFSITL